MEIQFKTAYTVSPVDQPPLLFDRIEDAIACVERALHNAFGRIDRDEFEGSVRWGTEEVPATPFDRLLYDYIDELHDEGGVDGVDRDDPFLLIECNVRGGYWLTTGTSPEELVDNHLNQEYQEDWEIEGIYDTATGDQVHGTVTQKVSY